MVLFRFFKSVWYWSKVISFTVMLLLSNVSTSIGQDHNADLTGPTVDPAEVEALYQVLDGINYEIDWRSLFPGNPCTDGPHGVNCDVDNNTWHIVELNFGWVSEYVNNPPCSDNATISPALFQFSHLKKLFFYSCFTKTPTTIPSGISTLSSSLQHLTFQSNTALMGEIPPQIGSLINLDRLVLTDNNLSGTIPQTLGNLKSLQQLVLNNNGLAGSLTPATFENLSNLKVLDLSGNQFCGEIPGTLDRLSALQKLDLSHNQLSGYIPEELGNLESLQFLDLSSNKLNGSIPDSLHKLRSLRYLLLGNNRLGGLLPKFWGNLSSLIYVRLSACNYEGLIPDSFGLLQNLILLDLDSNRLTGSIPDSIGNLTTLYHLNVNGNLLSGPIRIPLSFMSRMGNNLNLNNNSGLCFDLPLTNISSLNLTRCNSRASVFTSKGTSQTQQALGSVSSSNGHVHSNRLEVETVILILCSAAIYNLSLMRLKIW